MVKSKYTIIACYSAHVIFQFQDRISSSFLGPDLIFTAEYLCIQVHISIRYDNISSSDWCRTRPYSSPHLSLRTNLSMFNCSVHTQVGSNQIHNHHIYQNDSPMVTIDPAFVSFNGLDSHSSAQNSSFLSRSRDFQAYTQVWHYSADLSLHLNFRTGATLKRILSLLTLLHLSDTQASLAWVAWMHNTEAKRTSRFSDSTIAHS